MREKGRVFIPSLSTEANYLIHSPKDPPKHIDPSVHVAPFRFAPLSFASRMSDMLRFTPLRSALLRSHCGQFFAVLSFCKSPASNAPDPVAMRNIPKDITIQAMNTILFIFVLPLFLDRSLLFVGGTIGNTVLNVNELLGHKMKDSELLFLVQHLPDLGGQFLYGEGLLDEIHPFIEYTVVGDDVSRIAGHEQALEVRVEGQ